MAKRAQILGSFFFVAAGLVTSLNAQAGEATQAVIKAIESKDCASAVRELNLALAGASAEALMLGGAMFEQGLCLKPNVERAARLYTRAADAGATGARARLAALHASPLGGPDKGAAIWWAHQAELPLPKPCLVAGDIRADAERFVQTLNSWPSGVLDACVYATGVLGTMGADFSLGAAHSKKDGISVDFHMAEGRLEVGLVQMGQALIDSSPRVVATQNMVGANNIQQGASPDQMRALIAQEELQTLSKRVQVAGNVAIARFPKPAIAADSAWRLQFSIEAGKGP